MPNGARLSYRVRGGPVPLAHSGSTAPMGVQQPYAPPSPAHTSDSEDTWEEKRLWRAMASKSMAKWKRMTQHLMRQRIEAWLRAVFFRHRPRLHAVAPRVAMYTR